MLDVDVHTLLMTREQFPNSLSRVEDWHVNVTHLHTPKSVRRRM